jgi:hypothetical protein
MVYIYLILSDQKCAGGGVCRGPYQRTSRKNKTRSYEKDKRSSQYTRKLWRKKEKVDINRDEKERYGVKKSSSGTSFNDNPGRLKDVWDSVDQPMEKKTEGKRLEERRWGRGVEVEG